MYHSNNCSYSLVFINKHSSSFFFRHCTCLYTLLVYNKIISCNCPIYTRHLFAYFLFSIKHRTKRIFLLCSVSFNTIYCLCVFLFFSSPLSILTLPLRETCTHACSHYIYIRHCFEVNRYNIETIYSLM